MLGRAEVSTPSTPRKSPSGSRRSKRNAESIDTTPASAKRKRSFRSDLSIEEFRRTVKKLEFSSLVDPAVMELPQKAVTAVRRTTREEEAKRRVKNACWLLHKDKTTLKLGERISRAREFETPVEINDETFERAFELDYGPLEKAFDDVTKTHGEVVELLRSLCDNPSEEQMETLDLAFQSKQNALHAKGVAHDDEISFLLMKYAVSEDAAKDAHLVGIKREIDRAKRELNAVAETNPWLIDLARTITDEGGASSARLDRYPVDRERATFSTVLFDEDELIRARDAERELGASDQRLNLVANERTRMRYSEQLGDASKMVGELRLLNRELRCLEVCVQTCTCIGLLFAEALLSEDADALENVEEQVPVGGKQAEDKGGISGFLNVAAARVKGFYEWLTGKENLDRKALVPLLGRLRSTAIVPASELRGFRKIGESTETAMALDYPSGYKGDHAGELSYELLSSTQAGALRVNLEPKLLLKDAPENEDELKLWLNDRKTSKRNSVETRDANSRAMVLKAEETVAKLDGQLVTLDESDRKMGLLFRKTDIITRYEVSGDATTVAQALLRNETVTRKIKAASPPMPERGAANEEALSEALGVSGASAPDNDPAQRAYKSAKEAYESRLEFEKRWDIAWIAFLEALPLVVLDWIGEICIQYMSRSWTPATDASVLEKVESKLADMKDDPQYKTFSKKYDKVLSLLREKRFQEAQDKLVHLCVYIDCGLSNAELDKAAHATGSPWYENPAVRAAAKEAANGGPLMRLDGFVGTVSGKNYAELRARLSRYNLGRVGASVARYAPIVLANVVLGTPVTYAPALWISADVGLHYLTDWMKNAMESGYFPDFARSFFSETFQKYAYAARSFARAVFFAVQHGEALFSGLWNYAVPFVTTAMALGLIRYSWEFVKGSTAPGTRALETFAVSLPASFFIAHTLQKVGGVLNDVAFGIVNYLGKSYKAILSSFGFGALDEQSSFRDLIEKTNETVSNREGLVAATIVLATTRALGIIYQRRVNFKRKDALDYENLIGVMEDYGLELSENKKLQTWRTLTSSNKDVLNALQVTRWEVVEDDRTDDPYVWKMFRTARNKMWMFRWQVLRQVLVNDEENGISEQLRERLLVALDVKKPLGQWNQRLESAISYEAIQKGARNSRLQTLCERHVDTIRNVSTNALRTAGSTEDLEWFERMNADNPLLNSLRSSGAVKDSFLSVLTATVSLDMVYVGLSIGLNAIGGA